MPVSYVHSLLGKSILLLTVLPWVVNAQSLNTDLKFRFGKQILQSAHLVIDTALPFSNENGYGFDFETAKNVQINDVRWNYELDSLFYQSDPQKRTIMQRIRPACIDL